MDISTYATDLVDEYKALAIIRNNATRELLDGLSTHSSDKVRQEVAKHELTSTNVLEKLSKDPNVFVVSEANKNKNLHPLAIIATFNSDSEDFENLSVFVQIALEYRLTKMPVKYLTLLNDSALKTPSVAKAILRNKRTSSSLLTKLLNFEENKDRADQNVIIYEGLASHKKASPELLVRICKSGIADVEVLLLILNNPSTPHSLFVELCNPSRNSSLTFVKNLTTNKISESIIKRDMTFEEVCDLYTAVTGDTESEFPQVGVRVIKKLIISTVFNS